MTGAGSGAMDDSLGHRLADLDNRLRELGSVVVAFSGGADSAFLLAAAVQALGSRSVIAATAVSPSLPGSELQAAADFARGLGVRHVTPRTDEMSRPGFVANGADRCFHCKSELLSVLAPLGDQLGMAAIAVGTNADDVLDRFRPGIRAAAIAGGRTPLADAGLTKSQVRAASRAWGLSTADKPAAACLSSRVAYGLQISPRRLDRIEQSERGLRAAMLDAGLPVQNLRVRDLGDRARVEVDAELVSALVHKPHLLESVTGFEAVEIDHRGFRSGSMNEALDRRES